MAEVLKKEKLQALSPKKRIVEMDVLRGFALFGVLLVNLTIMSGATEKTSLDSGVYSLISFLGEGKFYTIFSILFGLGFYFFMHKSDALGSTQHEKKFIRRLFALLFFGLLHFLFIWSGDILHTYAMVGFLLLRKYQRSNGSLKKNIVILLVISCLIMGLIIGFAYDSDIKDEIYDVQVMKEKKEMMASGSFVEAFTYRLREQLPYVPNGFIISIPKILALFYIGYSLGKMSLFQNLKHHRKSISKLLKISGILFFLSILLMVFMENRMGLSYRLLEGFIYGILYECATLAGSCFYICGLLHIMKDHIPKLLMPLRYLGQMALTGYLSQTIIWSFLLHGYGLGLYQKIPMSMIPVLALVFFIGQVYLSKLWLKYHKFGPMEKVWRTLTYGQN